MNDSNEEGVMKVLSQDQQQESFIDEESIQKRSNPPSLSLRGSQSSDPPFASEREKSLQSIFSQQENKSTPESETKTVNQEPREQQSIIHNDSSISSSLLDGPSRGSLQSSLRAIRRQAKTRPPQTPASVAMRETPGIFHVDYPAGPPPNWSQNNDSEAGANAFQEDEPLDPLMDEIPSARDLPRGNENFQSFRSAVEAKVETAALHAKYKAMEKTNKKRKKKKKRKRITFLVVLVIVIVIVGISIGLKKLFQKKRVSDENPPEFATTSPSPSALINFCTRIDFSNICTTDEFFFSVPECAKSRYETLLNEFIPQSSLISPNLTRETSDGLEMVTQPCEPSYLALLSLAAVSAYDTVQNPRDYYALASLYFSTRGQQWSRRDGWLQNPNVCDWFGVTCLSEDESISKEIQINLERNNIQGSLPTEIGMISSLTIFLINHNDIGGTIPSEIGMLGNLRRISAQGVNLEGSIPTELGSCQQLRHLTLESRDLSGPIPTELGQLKNYLKTLNLWSPSLNGTIPTEIGLLGRLKSLAFINHGLSGTFPSELGLLSSSTKLQILGGNDVKGEFLPHILGLSNLVNLEVQCNSSSTIPSNISKLSSLQILNLNANFFNGTIPTEIGLLDNLEKFALVQQDLTGTIPSELGQLTNIKTLQIGQTQITGAIPIELINLGQLSTLNLDANFLNGTLPLELCSFKEQFQNGIPFCTTRRVKACVDGTQCE